MLWSKKNLDVISHFPGPIFLTRPIIKCAVRIIIGLFFFYRLKTFFNRFSGVVPAMAQCVPCKNGHNVTPQSS